MRVQFYPAVVQAARGSLIRLFIERAYPSLDSDITFNVYESPARTDSGGIFGKVRCLFLAFELGADLGSLG